MFLVFESNAKEIKIKKKNNLTLIQNVKSYGVSLDQNKNIYIPDFKNNLVFVIDNYYKKINTLENNNDILISNPHSIAFLEKKLLLVNLGKKNQNGNIILINEKDNNYKIIKNFYKNKSFKKPASIFVDQNNLIYVSDVFENKILIFNEEFSLLNWIGLLDQNMTNDFKKKNLFDIKLKNPHGIYKLKEFLIVCDTHNHRILFFKNDKIYGWFENINKNKIGFFLYNEEKYINQNVLNEMKGPLDLAIFNNYMIVTESYNSNRVLKIDLKKLEISEIKLTFKGKNKLRNPYEIKIIDNIVYIADPGSENIKIFSSDLLK